MKQLHFEVNCTFHVRSADEVINRHQTPTGITFTITPLDGIASSQTIQRDSLDAVFLNQASHLKRAGSVNVSVSADWIAQRRGTWREDIIDLALKQTALPGNSR